MEVDQDVIIEKVSSIQAYIKRITDNIGDNIHSLSEPNVQDIAVLNLQRAMQLTIDIALHVVSQEKLGVPKTLKESFELLSQQHIIERPLAETMKKMVGFRNIAVHDYQSIKSEILESIIQNHLKDLEEFYTIIVKKYASAT